MRNIRHKNEQVYLAPIPRGFDIYRVSLAAKMSGLDLPARRDIKLIPYALGSVNKDFTRADGDQVDKNGDVGVDLKWGIRPNLTLDATVNTDFAQVEADEEQVNLTRFDLFFPEKRPFFLENASTFQFGKPQQIDLFFSRRIGLSPPALPIDILGGARLSGKLRRMERRRAEHPDRRRRGRARERSIGPANNFSVLRVQREVGRSSYGAIFVNRQGTGELRGRRRLEPRLRRRRQHAAVDEPARLGVLRAHRHADDRVTGPKGSDYSGRAFYNFTNNLWQISGGYSQVGENFNPEVGFLPRRGYRRPEFRAFFQPQPKNIEWIRRIAPHISYNAFWGFDESCRPRTGTSTRSRFSRSRAAASAGSSITPRTIPTAPFTVFNRDGRRVVIPAGQYTWWQNALEYLHNPSARVTGIDPLPLRQLLRRRFPERAS